MKSLLLKCSILLLAFLRVWADQQDAAAQGPDPEVEVVSEKPGWERAWTHEAMEPLYNATLYPDLAVFQDRVRLPSALGIANQLRRYHINSTRVKRGTAVVVIRDGKVHGITFEDFAPAFRIRLDSVVSELQRFHDAGHIKLENTIFILNTRDVPVCTLGFCHVPIFSAVKQIRNGRPYSHDLLVPLMAYPHEKLVFYPPDRKLPQGAMASYMDEAVGSDSSCRSLVHRFASEEYMGQYIAVLDTAKLLTRSREQSAAKAAHVSGIVGGLGDLTGRMVASDGGGGLVVGVGAGEGADVDGGLDAVSFGAGDGEEAAPPPPPEQLSRYTLIISCDYKTANPGLAWLLHTNSLVLKGRSYWYEFYYRALQSGVHIREFEPGFAAEAVRDLLKPSSKGKVKEMAEQGQRFAYKYLSQRSRALFYEKAISGYNQLFGPGYMEATVADLPKDRDVNMKDILALRMYPSSWRQGLA